MPDPYERHGRGSGEWDGQPPRTQQRAAAAADDPDPARRGHGKRDPGLCKGMHWKAPHQPVLRQYSWNNSTCGWTVYWHGREPSEPVWWCGHQEYCSACGKQLQFRLLGKQCPGWHPMTKAEQTQLDAKRQDMLDRAARWRYAPRKPPITGKQGYRKPKKKKGT